LKLQAEERYEKSVREIILPVDKKPAMPDYTLNAKWR
jgi:hypothetical protein